MRLAIDIAGTAVLLLLVSGTTALPQQFTPLPTSNTTSLFHALAIPPTYTNSSTYQLPPLTNTTTDTTLTDDRRDIFCVTDASKHRTTVPTCRHTLNFLKNLPDYPLRQPFKITPPQPGRTRRGTPSLPPTYRGITMPEGPPFFIETDEADCVIAVKVDNPLGQEEGIEAVFSWRDVRATATRIVEFCDEEMIGRGGVTRIGVPDRGFGVPGWAVYAVGKPWVWGADGGSGEGGNVTVGGAGVGKVLAVGSVETE